MKRVGTATQSQTPQLYRRSNEVAGKNTRIGAGAALYHVLQKSALVRPGSRLVAYVPDEPNRNPWARRLYLRICSGHPGWLLGSLLLSRQKWRRVPTHRQPVKDGRCYWEVTSTVARSD